MTVGEALAVPGSARPAEVWRAGPGSVVPASGSALRLHDLFDRRLQADPDQAFLIGLDDTLTLRDIAVWVDRLADELSEAGVRRGDRVLTVAENSAPHVALVLACSRLGAWSCGVNARASKGELAKLAGMADARISYFTTGVSDAARAHARDAGAGPSAIEGLSRSAPRSMARAEEGELADSVAAMIFTSGTTGESKGVMVSHAGLTHFGWVSAESRRLSPQDRSYACIPMTHIFGLATVLAASLHAGSALLMRARFDPAEVVDALAQYGLSQLQGPPAMFTRLLSYLDDRGIARPEAPALRYLYAGAAPLDLGLKRAIEARFGRPLHHGYGLSEYAGALCLPQLDEWRDDSAAGYLVVGGELRIVTAEGREAAVDEVGEIWMRGIGLMPGYFRNDEATAAVMRPGGWYASGDLGRIDPNGALHIVGRLKEMIIRSGFNVYPAEVERVLNELAGVVRSAVIGRREADGNEEVIAFLEIAPGACAPAPEQVQAHVDEHLAPYKRPTQVIHRDAFPMTLSGKVLKRELLASITPETESGNVPPSQPDRRQK
ncbi:MAG: Long-chain-fatty-acid--CoA ligase [Pseudomonadota bacterium]